MLHGGLTRDERAAVLDVVRARSVRAAARDRRRGEGLNLHHDCRLVVNLELPWNPMRLEQRIGRVDRIGQRRTVHAFHLIADGTGEDADAGAAARARRARAQGRHRRARSARTTSVTIARLVMEPWMTMTMTTVDLRAEAIAEARRLSARASAACATAMSESLVRLEADGAWIAMARGGRA